MEAIQAQLMIIYAHRFRRIWVARSRLNSVCITVFPVEQTDNCPYRFVTRLKVSQSIDVAFCQQLIETDLVGWSM